MLVVGNLNIHYYCTCCWFICFVFKMALSCLRYKKSHAKEVFLYNKYKIYPKPCYAGEILNKMDIFKLNITKINLDLKCGCVSVNFQTCLWVSRAYCEIYVSQSEYSHYCVKWVRMSRDGFEEMFYMYNNITKVMFSHIHYGMRSMYFLTSWFWSQILVRRDN